MCTAKDATILPRREAGVLIGQEVGNGLAKILAGWEASTHVIAWASHAAEMNRGDESKSRAASSGMPWYCLIWCWCHLEHAGISGA